MPRSPACNNAAQAARRLGVQSTLLLLLSITVLAATGAIAGLSQAAQQGTPNTTPNTTVVTIEFRLGGSNDTVVNRVECGNLTVVAILSGDNTTTSGRVVFSLRVEGTQGDAMSILSRAYDCVSRRSDMSIARIVLDAVINATDTATRSKPQPVTQAQSQIEPLTVQAEVSKTQASQQDAGSPQQAVTGEGTGTAVGQTGAVEAPMSAGVQDATTTGTGEPSITGLLMPLAAGTLLGLLFYYLARIL